jgi:hypothetical protein
MGDESQVRDVVDAVAGLVKEVPIYQDVVQPAAQEIGRGLQTVAKTVHIALAPISIMVWGYDQIRDFVLTKVADRLKNVPPENIVTPKVSVAGPALEALRFAGGEEGLSDMYANLLASAMDKNTAQGAHPAFVEIIKQLTPDEAKIVALFRFERAFPLIDLRWEYKPNEAGRSGGMSQLRNFSMFGVEAGVEFPENMPAYIDNICRLGLADVPAMYQYTTPGVYDPLENSGVILSIKSMIEQNQGLTAVIDRKGLQVSEMGKQFARVCVIPKS